MKYKDLIEGQLRILATKQNQDGSFSNLSSPNASFSNPKKIRKTTFFTAQILIALAPLKTNAVAQAIAKKGVAFLLAERSTQWSWNYWARTEPSLKTSPYPNDLDDTFSALAAIQLWDPEKIDGEATAYIAKILTSTEENVGGPYRTWLVTNDSPKAWKDIDLAVNANIAYFLHLQGIELPNLSEFFSGSKIESLYYPNRYPILSFLGRSKHLNPDHIYRDHQFLQPTSVLVAAQMTVGLLHQGEPIAKVGHLLTYLRDNPWKAEPFCLDPAAEGVHWFAGSPELTTAICLEALALSEVATPKTSTQTKSTSMEALEKTCATLPEPLRGELQKAVLKIQRVDQETPILTLAHVVHTALGNPSYPGQEKMLVDLGVATAFGWIAYTIFDDFLDQEGAPNLLPAACTALRLTDRTFRDILPDHTTFQAKVVTILNTIDASNTWEVLSTRPTYTVKKITWKSHDIPQYGTTLQPLADRSLGHLLAPLAVCYASGKDKAAKAIEVFFTHFLIARQVNDDAHDWKEDLQRGQINAVATHLLSKRLQDGKISTSLPDLCGELEGLLWKKEVEWVCKTITSHLHNAERALTACAEIKNPEALFKILKPLYASVEKVKIERTKTLDFLKHYA